MAVVTIDQAFGALEMMESLEAEQVHVMELARKRINFLQRLGCTRMKFDALLSTSVSDVYEGAYPPRGGATDDLHIPDTVEQFDL